MGWSPAQVDALENCGIKVEDATGDIQWREFETIDIIKPDPIKSPKSNIQYEATRLPDYNKVGNTMKQNMTLIPSALSAAVFAATMLFTQSSMAVKPTIEGVMPLTHTCSGTLKFIAQDMKQAQFEYSFNKVCK